MTFHFLSRDGHRLFARDDALSAKHYCEDFAFEACFPIRADRPLEVGMIAAWQDDDDLWEAHEIVSAEPDAYGDSVTLTGCHIALSELRSAVLAEAKYDGAAIAAVLDGLLADTPWQRGVLPAAAESDAARRERYRVTTRVSRLNLRSGPGTRYKSLGLYKKGTYVSLVEKTNSSWYRVEAPDGRTGWMSTTYLTRDGSVAAAAEGECRATLDETWITAWAALEAAAKSAGLLLAPRVALTDAGISGRWIDLRPTDPEYRGVRLTCDSNIRQAGVKFDISGLYTSMTGLGRDDMTFSDAAWSTSGGDPADKPRGQTFVEIPSARALWGRSRSAIVRFPEETDASRLLARTWEQLTAAAQPRVTIDATIADLYPLGYGGQSLRLYDAVQVILRPIGLRMNARITGLTRDLVEPERTRPVIGTVSATDIVQDVLTAASGAQRIDSWQVRSISGDSISPGTVGSAQLKDASIGYAKIAVAAVEQLAANAISAVSAHIAHLVAGEIEADRLYADLATIAVAQITTANIKNAAIDWAQIATLTAQVATIAKAEITTANIISADIRWADIQSLNAAVADVARAKIADAQITTAQIADLRAEIARVITLAAQDGKFDFASIKDLLAGAMILEEGVAGSVYIKNLVATRANFVGATLGELVLRGADSNYYAVTVQADGTIRTQPVTVSDGETSAGQTTDGRQIVATTANIADLNAGNIRAASAIISEIFAGALQAGKISAQEAFLASATVPELRVTALKAIGDTLDISANAQIRLLVSDVATAQGAANAAQSSANAAMEKATANATAIEQNAQQIALRATQADLSGMASTLRGEMTVAADGIRAQVSSLGGNNLLRNGGFYFGLDGWERMEYNVNGDWRNLYVETGASDYRANEVPNLVLHAQNETGNFGVTQDVYGLRKNTDYTISGYVASHRCNRAIIAVTNRASTNWKMETAFQTGWGGTNLSYYDRFAYTFNTGDDSDLRITLYSNNFGENAFVWWAQIQLEEGTVATAWSPHASETYTSGVEIHDNRVDVKTGGSFNVHSGSVDISTSNFRVSVQKQGDPESEVIGIDPDYGRISVDELNARNMRPYVDYAEYRLSNLGSIREFANILSRTSFGQVSMILDADEYGTTPVRFEGVMAQNVSIVSDGNLRRSPPWIFGRCNANFYVDGVCWSCLTGYDANPQNGNTAIVAYSGNILLRNCCILGAHWGILGYQNARISWCGWTYYADGFCTDVFAVANEGADISVYGHVPGANNTGVLILSAASRGLTRDIVQHSSQAASTPEYLSATLTGALGWISTKRGWSDGVAYQGYTTGKGECYGCFRFALPSGAQSIVSAALTLHRKSSTGKGAPVDIHLYGSATAWGSRPALGTQYASRADAVLAGNTVTLDVTAAAQALLAGSIVQLVAYEGDGSTMSGQVYSTDYCAWDAATLDVTYTT